MTPLKIRNRDARRLWLHTLGLAESPTGPLDLISLIKQLGFVQIDTIRNVTRAHHHILWSRNQNYREKMLWPLLGKHRTLFEHFTHDASLIPMDFYPMWQRQFQRLGDKVARHEWYQSGLGKEAIRAIHARISKEGPLSTHAFDSKIEGERQMWSRPPHKKALDQMWYAGVLTTSHRENFIKFYDLSSRVIPDHHRAAEHSEEDQVNWLCENALDRLSFGSPGEIQRFWAAADAKEVKAWIEGNTSLIAVQIEAADKTIQNVFAPADIEERLTETPEPSGRLRLLNPFDPAIRDRTRLLRLFGFDYRNEMFVPAAQRKWGYYVYPLLERDRFVGRIELKANRARGEMTVSGLWPEPGVSWSNARLGKLESELDRFARLAGISDISWQVDPKG